MRYKYTAFQLFEKEFQTKGWASLGGRAIVGLGAVVPIEVGADGGLGREAGGARVGVPTGDRAGVTAVGGEAAAATRGVLIRERRQVVADGKVGDAGTGVPTAAGKGEWGGVVGGTVAEARTGPAGIGGPGAAVLRGLPGTICKAGARLIGGAGAHQVLGRCEAAIRGGAQMTPDGAAAAAKATSAMQAAAVPYDYNTKCAFLQYTNNADARTEAVPREFLHDRDAAPTCPPITALIASTQLAPQGGAESPCIQTYGAPNDNWHWPGTITKYTDSVETEGQMKPTAPGPASPAPEVDAEAQEGLEHGGGAPMMATGGAHRSSGLTHLTIGLTRLTIGLTLTQG